ncbi:MAG: kynureninase [Saprospiraceae bacterium]
MTDQIRFEGNKAFALEMDSKDELRNFRDQYHIPKKEGKDAIYFCGNSLGLQPKNAAGLVENEMNRWRDLGVEGHFKGEWPWTQYHKAVVHAAMDIVGAKEEEIIHMNTLTVNLHLLMASFYKPTKERYLIIMEAGAFPSDQYVVESQVRMHGFDPETSIVEVSPVEGETLISTEQIKEVIRKNGDRTALVLFGGIQYFTGQCLDMAEISKVTHETGAFLGLDLAHAVGNVPLKLHEWGVDFAAWCTYKYLNSGPGAIGGVYIHEKYATDPTFPRLAGWYGYNAATRFLMQKKFQATPTAEGWQLSNAPILSFAPLIASHSLFQQAGMERLRNKSILLTSYLTYLLDSIPAKERVFEIITPRELSARGAQLSLFTDHQGKALFQYLSERGVVCDWRENNLTEKGVGAAGVIRVAPTPMYNTFEEVYQFADNVSTFCGR